MASNFYVGDYRIEPDLNRIAGEGADVQIEPRAMEVLVYLAGHAGYVIPKERLIRAVWKDTFVADGVLWQCISRLREVFGDDPKAPSYIQTVPRRGYVLIADVSHPEDKAPRYRVREKLGQGAMGEVFLADDTLLRRKVALKFLSADRKEDVTLRKRLLKEARAAAALDHPYACKTYTVGQLNGRDFIVLEYLKGQTLREKLARGRLPLADALQIAGEMTEALAAAHEQGIIHRDLKPANVMISETGHSRIMDFGLACRLPLLDGNEDVSGTLSSLAREDLSPGTLAYMSPEQLRGGSVDERSDLFGLGIVLYEMLTGSHPFRRGPALETASGILTAEPLPLCERNPQLPRSLEAIVERLLAKRREERYRSASDVLVDLQVVQVSAGGNPPARTVADLSDPTRARSTRGVSPWWVAAAGLTVLLIGALLLRPFAWFSGWEATDSVPKRFELAIETDELNGRFAISPGGDRLVFPEAGNKPLFARSLEHRDKVPLVGSEGGRMPFFSPDGQWVGFFADGAIRKAPMAGGPAEIVIPTNQFFGGSWGPDNTIVFSNEDQVLWQVAADGGRPTQISTRVRDPGHFSPSFLPDGSGVLFWIWHGESNYSVALLDRDRKEYEVLIRDAGRGLYSPTGHLLYTRADGLYAAPFDLETRAVAIDEEALMVRDIRVDFIYQADFALSAAGILAYLPGTQRPGELVRVSSDGRIETLPVPPAVYGLPRVSPDGSRILVEGRTPGRVTAYVVDPGSGLLRKAVSDETSHFPYTWSADGSRVTYMARRAPPLEMNAAWVPADGAGRPQVLISPEAVGLYRLIIYEWDSTGRFLFSRFIQEGRRDWDLGYFELDEAAATLHSPVVIEEGITAFHGASLSPDGRWLAYSIPEDSSGETHTWVRSFPDGAGRFVVARRARKPKWSPDGKRIYYWQGTTLQVVGVDPETESVSKSRTVLEFGPESRFQLAGLAGYHNWDVFPDGSLLMVRLVDETLWEPTTHFNITTGFFEELLKKVPVGR